MKYLPLLWSGIWRKPGRTALILLQVAIGFTLFGILQGLKSGVERSIANTRADVLYVGPGVFGGTPLPIAYADRLQSIAGVKTVLAADGIPTSYQNPKQFVFVLGIVPTDDYLTLLPDIFQVDPKALHALRDTRNGALITQDIGKKYGWHIGDRIPLTSSVLKSDGSGTWDFQIVGMMTDHEAGQGSFIVTNYTYLDESRAANKGTVRNFYVVASDPLHAGEVASAIDRAFTNSPNETQTQSFRELRQQQLQSIGDLNFAIRSIISAVLVALLFSTATMMMQTIRERTPELAVLKTLGFSDRSVFAMVVAEGVVVCVVAALVGLALATGVFPYASKFVPGLSMPTVVVGIGVVGAVFIALISAALPASRAARLQVAEALAGR
ncbi:MAG TPA: FtsX-like permease family protein [Steroidobacteraceae bacterium]|nr:FtsX-like permease family protein [Steroidobacteraceae bacterium]